MTIEITVRNFAPRPGFDIAECHVADAPYRAISRFGAEHSLCRMLRAAGIPDQPWTINGGSMFGPSIYKLADTTIRDNDRGCKVVEFCPFPRNGGAQKGGSDENDEN